MGQLGDHAEKACPARVDRRRRRGPGKGHTKLAPGLHDPRARRPRVWLVIAGLGRRRGQRRGKKTVSPAGGGPVWKPTTVTQRCGSL